MDTLTPRPADRLSELSRIVHAVDRASDLEAALQEVVKQTRAVMQADVCTVYFSDDAQRRHVVAATDGLASRYVGRLAVDFGSGVIGRVAQEQRPINLDHVPESMDQGFVEQTGLQPHAGFLGVPILHKAQVQGVLLVRQRHPRRFDHADEAFLATLASRLGGAIAYAKASGEICEMCRPGRVQSRCLEGRAGAPGVAIGTGTWVFSATELQDIPARTAEDIPREEARFLEALKQVGNQAKAMADSLQGRIADADRALFDAFAMILESPEIRESVVGLIREGQWAPAAVRTAIESYAGSFDTMDDPYLRQRATDLRALGTRLVARLLGEEEQVVPETGATVLIGKQLSAMDVGEALAGNLAGIVSADGSTLSHAAILARSLGIPAVMGVSGVPLSQLDGQTVIVDGNSGRVHVRPDAATRHTVEAEIVSRRTRNAALEPVRNLPACTPDGKRISLFINAGLTAPHLRLGDAGSDGIGLFRSELPFMMFDRFPSEAEQLAIYREALAAAAPAPLVLRTLDAGGDKPLPYLSESEGNPALGWRGIRFTLDHPDIFLTQIRAALRANIGLGNLRLMFPMISALEEVLQARRVVDQAVEQLTAEGLAVTMPPIGIMVEVPSALFQVEVLARQVDFLSVGTNDLAQYLLATDRNNPRVSARLDPLHPSMLSALQLIVTSAGRAGKPVSVCGEMASDPATAMVLIGMGFDGLSLNPTSLLEVKWAIRKVSFRDMQSLARQTLTMDDAEGIRRLLKVAVARTGLTEADTTEVPAP